MKKALSVLLSLTLLLGLTACGAEVENTSPQTTETPAISNSSDIIPSVSEDKSDVGNTETAPETSEEAYVFVPDYTEGNENKISLLSQDMLWIQQDNWLYYGASHGGYMGLNNKDTILKMPVGGSPDDIVKIYDRYEAVGTLYNFECQCGNEPYSAEVDEILAVMGDWIYLKIGSDPDAHIYRLRTDGKVMEQVMCMNPNEETRYFYWAMRDDHLYYISRSVIQLDASTTEERISFNALLLESEPQEAKRFMNSPAFSTSMSLNNPGDFVIGNDFYFKNATDGQYYKFGTDEQFIKLSDFVYSYVDKSIYENLVTASRVPLFAEPGSDGNIYLYASGGGYEVDYGVYVLEKGAWENFPTQFHLSSDERDNEQIWTVLQPYLIPNSEHILRPKALSVDGGVVFGGEDSELQYYSFDTKTTTKINNDGEVDYWAWPGDGYLYYKIIADIYRVKLDGTGWEDVSWIANIPDTIVVD